LQQLGVEYRDIARDRHDVFEAFPFLRTEGGYEAANPPPSERNPDQRADVDVDIIGHAIGKAIVDAEGR
jgi:hypothetical protein